jgi:hypothetical protein
MWLVALPHRVSVCDKFILILLPVLVASQQFAVDGDFVVDGVLRERFCATKPAILPSHHIIDSGL